jgi:hypothetical protein
VGLFLRGSSLKAYIQKKKELEEKEGVKDDVISCVKKVEEQVIDEEEEEENEDKNKFEDNTEFEEEGGLEVI